MIPTARIAAFGGDDLRASIVALGFEPGDDRPALAVIDLRDADAVGRAALLPAATPRVFVGTETDRSLMSAVGAAASFVVGHEPAVLGPAIMAALPRRDRGATRVIVLTGTRGGVGRTLLATNLARRIGRRRRATLCDATGTGAAAWWLGVEARAWSALEGLVGELSGEHIGVAAEETAGVRCVGGSGRRPTRDLLLAVVRAALSLDDLVIVDAPLVTDELAHAACAVAQRTLLLAYDDPLSLLALEAFEGGEAWVIASQSRARRLGQAEVFRALPRDEGAIAAALTTRGPVGGALGHAYDELSELLLIDAS